tara:strand:- start:1625 stop:1828 length:204 start_codon:yes stop_codon:yes gene_type:complete
MKKDNKVPTTNKVGSQIKTMFDKEAGFEANALALITAIWVSPILLAYFILKFAIIRPIKSLFGVKKK